MRISLLIVLVTLGLVKGQYGIYSDYNEALFDQLQKDLYCQRGQFNATADQGIIKSYRYPENLSKSRHHCNWIISPKPATLIRIRVDVFELGLYDLFKISELIEHNGTVHVITRADLKGSWTSKGLQFESLSDRSTIRVEFLAPLKVISNDTQRFHLTWDRISNTSSNCGEQLIFLKNESDNEIVEFKENQRCSRVIFGPPGKSIEAKRLVIHSSSSFFMEDIYHGKTLSMPCQETNINSTVGETYRSYTSRVLLQQCTGSAKFELRVKPGHCSPEPETIHANSTKKFYFFGTPNFYTDHYEYCETLNYSAKIVFHQNASHFTVFRVQHTEKHGFPIAINYNVPLFDKIATNDLLDLHANPIPDFDTPFSFDNIGDFYFTEYTSRYFPATNFSVHVQRGAVKFNLEQLFLPIECHEFYNGSPVLEIEDNNITIPLNFPSNCAPIELWMRLRNRAGKHLTIRTNSSVDGDGIRMNVLFDGKVQRSFSMNKLITLQDFKEETVNTTNFYAHLRIWHRSDRNITMNITFVWEDECNCNNYEKHLDSGEVVLTSPNYPSNYCNKLSCHYNFTVPDRAKVRVHVTDFDLPDFWGDFLYFTAGNDSKRIRVVEPMETTLSSGRISVFFHTDGADVGRGFKIVLSPDYKDQPLRSYWIVLYIVAGVIIFTACLVGVWMKVRQMPRFSNQIFYRFKNDDTERLVLDFQAQTVIG